MLALLPRMLSIPLLVASPDSLAHDADACFDAFFSGPHYPSTVHLVAAVDLARPGMGNADLAFGHWHELCVYLAFSGAALPGWM